MTLSNDIENSILNAVDRRFDEQVSLLKELVSYPSLRGREQDAQKFVAAVFGDRNYHLDCWNVELDDIAHLPGFSPVEGPYEDALNVVASHCSRKRSGRSLILNGHIDVVPVGPEDMWTRSPFDPAVEGDWLYGRGSGDMKAGLIANIAALDALREIGYAPAADVFIQSVVEEECTGNGALACLQRGYRADAALIPEPFNEHLVSAQVGVIWFQVRLQGIPVHVADAGEGFNAIQAAVPLMEALNGLEARWNLPKRRSPHFKTHDHPIIMNVGRFQGGDWPSSVPAWSCFDVRIAVYPGQDLAAARADIETCLRDAAEQLDHLRQNPPEIVYQGFQAEGYALSDDARPVARDAVSELSQAHLRVTGSALQQTPITATTDARFFGLYADTPALVYGPVSERIHGIDERVSLESIRRVTQSIALFVARWCGLEGISG